VVLEAIGKREELFKKSFPDPYLLISGFHFGRPATYDREE
jgi:hypothetical protein